MIPALEQRCWTHEAREAVCRCPECGRSYCRECVTEHEARLLCASCIAARAKSAPRRRRGRAGAVWLAVAGVFLAWVLFFSAGEAMILIVQRVERTSWQAR